MMIHELTLENDDLMQKHLLFQVHVVSVLTNLNGRVALLYILHVRRSLEI